MLMRTRIKLLMAGLLVFALVSLQLLADKGRERTSKSFTQTPDGRFLPNQTKVKFINLTIDEKKSGSNLWIISGKATWAEGTGAKGKPALVPVNLYRPDHKRKTLKHVATYYTEDDGSYYFITRKIKGDYATGPVSSRAINMPGKVKAFFDEWKGKRQLDKSIQKG